MRYTQSEYQGFGDYTLYRLCDEFDPAPFQLLTAAGHFITRVLQIADVTEWSDLGGRAIRAKVRDGLIIAIGHILEDDWFEPGVDFANLD